MTAELENRAYNIIERDPRLTAEQCAEEVEEGRREYDSIWATAQQRRRALDRIEIYSFLRDMLQRARA